MRQRNLTNKLLEQVISTQSKSDKTIVHTLYVMEFDNGDIDIFVQHDEQRKNGHTLSWTTLNQINIRELQPKSA